MNLMTVYELQRRYMPKAITMFVYGVYIAITMLVLVYMLACIYFLTSL